MDEWELPIEEIGRLRAGRGGGLVGRPGWKDELNLAEFPIAALTDRVPDGQTTLVFEDKLERRDSPPIVRRLTIMGTHKHGLPTSLDDEVLVGLIQLTKRRSNFTDAEGPVLAVRADRAARLAAERAELPADRGGAAPLGRRAC